ncbi:TPA: hypothetical protein RRF25_000210 [Klebsiella pneumoniae]|nr:hypothetical protein [Klebsiella pneumoniae]HCT5999908.1 hypothetical protein [Klebsiella pneumoniae]HDY7358449.1 hypothetical protein [Klebsiella pneumoniae]
MNDSITNTTKYHTYMMDLLSKVGPWLDEIGIKYNATRFGSSTKIFKKWIDGKINPTFQEYWGICELLDIMEFYNSFNPPNDETKKLLHLIKAGSTTLEKSQNNSARDYAFELKIASRFKRAGFKIINDNSHDVVVQKDEIKLYIECKRPRREGTIIERIRYAYDVQLSDLEDKSEQGIICIDLSNVIYNDFVKKFEHDGCENISTNQETLEEYRDQTDKRFKKLIETQAPDIAHGVRMIILYYSFPVAIEKSPASNTAEFVKFNHFAKISSHSDEIDLIISKALIDSTGKHL